MFRIHEKLIALVFLLCITLFSGRLTGQTFTEWPGYERFQAASQIRNKLGREGWLLDVKWSEDSSKLSFLADGKKKTYGLKEKKFVTNEEFEAFKPPKTFDQDPRGKRRRVRRAEQREVEISYSRKWVNRTTCDLVIVSRKVNLMPRR